jgi:phage baseplate assembly protein W
MKYADLRPNLDTHPVNGDILRFTDSNAISSQIKNLVMIDFYELPWRPTVGAGVPQTLFDNMGVDTEMQIRDRIRDTINKYVKRARLQDVFIQYDGQNGYTATIVYQPLDATDPISLKLILTRTR